MKCIKLLLVIVLFTFVACDSKSGNSADIEKRISDLEKQQQTFIKKYNSFIKNYQAGNQFYMNEK